MVETFHIPTDLTPVKLQDVSLKSQIHHQGSEESLKNGCHSWLQCHKKAISSRFKL